MSSKGLETNMSCTSSVACQAGMRFYDSVSITIPSQSIRQMLSCINSAASTVLHDCEHLDPPQRSISQPPPTF
ncbi:hypothetical protein DUNSADRAFT_17672 [Dunaliella salina]|uniref:Encoded protein n=1 Tax=Dunaliella salina TaxID=3046 RepID=A0ABQ7G1B8_DUNSA|nr:hypothetical protein DUNSADRAFT_17672 [Dunaliella salina]|eukprot:KAF5828402.1 hypothetical protein DUNSADRAFT_17672 [Dunaliella salina]